MQRGGSCLGPLPDPSIGRDEPVPLPVEGADLVQVPVMREELLLVMPPSHKLARKRRLTAEDLARQSWVLFERGSSTRRVIDDTFGARGIHPRIVMETENPEILKALTMIGMGLTILPYQSLAREARKLGDGLFVRAEGLIERVG